MRNVIRRFLRDSSGATGLEYALIASMLAIGVLAAVQAISTETETSFNAVDNAFSGATPTP